mmetsp:Transcript_7727/g.20185  ORF Transcript_7727/g.20185 Transcript_7727/m.20185 type:complete len:91 (-) Transcript_7727:938-1210(-)
MILIAIQRLSTKERLRESPMLMLSILFVKVISKKDLLREPPKSTLQTPANLDLSSLSAFQITAKSSAYFMLPDRVNLITKSRTVHQQRML